MTTHAPATLDALCALVSESGATPLVVRGAGTKTAQAGGAGLAIDLRGVAGIAGYDPAECVVTARAGTPVRDVASTLAAHSQYLPWDPPLVDDGATVGGMVASGWSGPGRYRYGGIRDFVIGARVIDGRGRLIASGGQVVKNAAGFLLHHALVGSAGRLGVIADVSLKVFPAPEATTTLVATFATLADALAAHERVRRDGLELDALDLVGTPVTLLVRIAGAAAAMPARVDRAARALGVGTDALTGDEERAVWARHVLRHTAEAPLVKVPSTPSRLPALLAACAPVAAWHISCGGAVVYLRPAPSLDAVRDALTRLDARGVVVAGPEAGRLVGRTSASPFADRVRGTLDPDGRFR
ncbi:MAG: FAD-binding protein [Vicinamibacterales bacterium]